jgi:hypothetical protein
MCFSEAIATMLILPGATQGGDTGELLPSEPELNAMPADACPSTVKIASWMGLAHRQHAATACYNSFHCRSSMMKVVGLHCYCSSNDKPWEKGTSSVQFRQGPLHSGTKFCRYRD